MVGGGIAGLAAAWRLAGSRLPEARSDRPTVTLLDASPRAGGTIGTTGRDGFLLEHGPDAFLTAKPQALALCRELGLAGEVVGTREQFRRSYLLREGRLIPVPAGFYLMAPGRLLPFLASPILSWRGKLRVLSEPWIRPREAGGESIPDESLGSFVTRRLGREALERIAAPMVAGIYGADPWDLSLESTLPQFLRMEREHGSIVRALRRGAAGSGGSAADASGPRYGLFASLRSGMRGLSDALVAALPAGTLRTGARATRLDPPASGRGWRVHVQLGAEIEADAVCLAVPAWAAAGMLRAADPVLADLLDGIPYGSGATVNLAYARSDVEHPLDAMGFVAAASERLSCLGVTFSSSKFEGRAPDGSVLLRAFVGGPAADAALAGSDNAIVAAVASDLRRILGAGEPRFAEVHRHLRALPRYRVGHAAVAARIEDRVRALGGLALAGNLLGGVGIPDCIASAERAVERLAPPEAR